MCHSVIERETDMSESKFLSCVLTESLLMLSLGLCMLIIPKITIVSFGLMMCLSFIIYGGYKVINALITKNFSRHFLLDIIVGLLLFVSGIMLFIAPFMDVMVIIGLCGVYFILKSLSSSAFSVQTRKTLNFWWMCLFLAILEFIFGVLVIILLPSAALLLIGILAGMDFILSGMVYMNMYISTKYMQG